MFFKNKVESSANLGYLKYGIKYFKTLDFIIMTIPIYNNSTTNKNKKRINWETLTRLIFNILVVEGLSSVANCFQLKVAKNGS